MSYRNPRFCYHHAALDAGSGSLAVTIGTGDPATSIERLRDLRASAVFRCTPDVVEQAAVQLDQGTPFKPRTNINRILVPAGHNLHTERVRLWLQNSPDASTGWTNLLHDDGVREAKFWHAAPHVIDIPVTETMLRGQRVLFYDTAQGGGDLELGELWWTRTVQPTTGIVPRWQMDREPNVLRSVTLGGESFNIQRGPARRVYDLEHRHISGADLALYEDLVRAVGVSGRPFWYEHPDSGDAIVTKQDFETPGDFTGFNATVASVSGRDGSAVSSTSIAAGITRIAHTFPAEMDLRNHFASIDVRIPTSMAWLTADADLDIIIASRKAELGSVTHWAMWRLGNYFLDIDTNETGTDRWWRIFLDLDSPTQTNIGAGLSVDLARVDHIVLRHDATAAGQAVYWDNLLVYDREKQPRLVELLSFDKSQDSPAPSSAGGPTYTVRMQMIEVLT